MTRRLEVQQSLDVPVGIDEAFNATLAMQLPVVCGRRYGPLPAIRRVDAQEGTWGPTIGQSRTIFLKSGGGTFRETLVEVEAPTSWSYFISDPTGPLALLTSHIDGKFAFAPAGAGTRITWHYDILARNAVAAPGLPVFGRFWRGYARQTLEELSRQLT